MKKKLLIIDFNLKPYIPEESLYTASTIQRTIPLEDINIVRVCDKTDIPAVWKHVEQYKDHNISVLMWLYDNFVTDWQIDMFFGLADELSEQKNTTITVSGGHPTIAHELFEREKCFDYIITGWPWLTDLSWLESGKQEAPTIVTSPRSKQFPDSANLMDAFERITNLERCVFRDDQGEYINYSHHQLCNNGCKFCLCTHYLKPFGGQLEKTDGRVADELDFLKNRLNINRAVLTNERCLEKHILSLQKAGFSLTGQADMCVKDMTPSFLDTIKETGVNCAFFGLESINPEVQKTIGKSFTLDELAGHLEYADSINLMMEGNMMGGLRSALGEPYTIDHLYEELAELAHFWRNHRNLRVLLRPFMPFVGTPLGDKLWKQSPQYSTMDARTYLKVIWNITMGNKLPEDMPLPPAYSNRETFYKILEVYPDFEALVRHLSSMYWHPPKNSHKRAACDLLTKHCFDRMERKQYGSAEFVENLITELSNWR